MILFLSVMLGVTAFMAVTGFFALRRKYGMLVSKRALFFQSVIMVGFFVWAFVLLRHLLAHLCN